MALGQQGGELFFGEPALNIEDLLQTDAKGHGVVNILAADQLMQSPQLYATFLLWLMSELFEKLPEVGDQEKPKLVSFLMRPIFSFNDPPSVLQNRIEQVVRLIRSKGVGVLVTQNPIDVPDTVLGSWGTGCSMRCGRSAEGSEGGEGGGADVPGESEGECGEGDYGDGRRRGAGFIS